VNGNSTRRVVVEPGGTGVVAHVGLHALGSFADRLGLGDALSSRIPWSGAGVPIHDRGKVLVQAALILSGGGESCLDIEHLRIGGDLFGSVPSDTTVARTFHEITSSTRSGIAEAMAEIRAEVWSRSSTTTGTDPVLLDIDASLVEIHSENKEQTAPTFKGGFGFHPLFCFADATGETLSALLRPGNAGSNTVADHITVLDDAIAQLPAHIAAGHHEGDHSDLVQRDIIMRADSAGCTEDFLEACRARNVGFYVSARRNAQVTAAIFDAIGIEEVWLPAVAQDGELKEGAAVAELTSLIDGAKFPSRTRLIIRREPLHPGAQRSLFPSLDYRYWGFYTDQDGDPRALDATMRSPVTMVKVRTSIARSFSPASIIHLATARCWSIESLISRPSAWRLARSSRRWRSAAAVMARNRPVSIWSVARPRSAPRRNRPATREIQPVASISPTPSTSSTTANSENPIEAPIRPPDSPKDMASRATGSAYRMSTASPVPLAMM